MDEEEKLQEYTTFNAMEREALMWGIPVYWFAVISFSFLIGTFLICLLLGWKAALIWGIFLAVIFIIVRVLCELDSKAMKRVEKLFKRIWMNIKYGRSLFLTPYNRNWNDVVRKRQALNFVFDKRENKR